MTTRNIKECETIKDCFLWAEQIFPNFWKFATCQKLTEKETETLIKDLNEREENFNTFLEQLIFASKLDDSEEGIKLLILGAQSQLRMQEFQKEDHAKRVSQKYQ